MFNKLYYKIYLTFFLSLLLSTQIRLNAVIIQKCMNKLEIKIPKNGLILDLDFGKTVSLIEIWYAYRSSHWLFKECFTFFLDYLFLFKIFF